MALRGTLIPTPDGFCIESVFAVGADVHVERRRVLAINGRLSSESETVEYRNGLWIAGNLAVSAEPYPFEVRALPPQRRRGRK